MNKTASYDLTIIVPIYNEKDGMDSLEKAMAAFIPKSHVSTCILLVDDGSKDGSDQLIEEICEKNPDFFYLRFERNAGLGAAIKAGIDYCQSKYLGYIDADLQTDPEDFNLLLDKIDEYDFVTGIRVERNDSISRKLQSKFGNGFRRYMTKDPITDTGCPLKIMKTEYAKRIPFFTGMHRFLAALIVLQNGRVYELPVRHYPRVNGQSKFNFRNRFWCTVEDCVAYRWMKSRYINYTVSEHNTGQ